MQIGIIVYSFSGHTFKVANILEQKLAAAGHQTKLVRLETVGPIKMSAQKAELKSVPPIDNFDTLVLAAPVHAGRMAAPMASYFEKVLDFNRKKELCLVTQFFPFKWGGKQTLQSMEAQCNSKGAQVIGTGSVTWACFQRKRRINDLVSEFVKLV